MPGMFERPTVAEVKRLPITPGVRDEAAHWVARLDGGALTARDGEAFDRWLAASPAHKAAFEQADALWTGLDQLAPRLAPPDMLAGEADCEDRGRQRGWIDRRAVAASVALLVVASASVGLLRLYAPPVYQTAIGEQRSVTLDDGSRVTLNTNTEVAVRFDARIRLIELNRGEALFEVAHNRARPFVVRSPYGSVRAVGTRFTVRIDEDRRLAILVSQGKVLVSGLKAASVTGGTAQARAIPLVGGQALEAGAQKLGIVRLSAEQINQELAWRQGEIVFSGISLAEAAGQMQRYSPHRLEVDPAVANYSVGGYFRTNDLDAFLQTVEGVFAVKVVRSGQTVRLVARPPS